MREKVSHLGLKVLGKKNGFLNLGTDVGVQGLSLRALNRERCF